MNLKGKAFRALAAAGLAAILTTGFAWASIGTGTVTASSLRLRSGAGTDSSTLTNLPRGAQVDVLEDAGGGWYKVSYKDMIGYASGEWLEIVAAASDASQPAPAAAAAEDGAGTVNVSTLNVRSGPGTTYDKVGTLKKGAAVTILEQADAWYKVSRGDLTGYVSSEYITLGLVARDGMVTTGTLNVRSGPGTAYGKVGTLKRGAAVSVEDDRTAGWYKISGGGLSGYVSSEYVTILGEEGASSSVGASAVSIAASLVGKRYGYGGVGPNSFDCSGFTRYVYKQLGYSLPHSSSSQYYSSGYFVSADSIQPGDLLFFFDRRYDSSGGRLPTTHVGIYAGNNQFIHASNYSTGVCYDVLFGSSHGSNFVAAKRIG